MKLGLMIVNIIRAYVLYHYISTPGLALATVCGSVVNALLNYICMTRKYPGMFKRADGVQILKIILSAVVMYAVLYFIYNAVTGIIDESTVSGSMAVAIVSGGVSGVVYLVLCLVLKVDVIINAINSLKGGKRLE